MGKEHLEDKNEKEVSEQEINAHIHDMKGDFLKRVSFLQTPLEKIFGDKSAKKLEKIGATTLYELLRLAPRKYYKKGELTKIQDLQEGDYVTVQVKVVSVNMKNMFARKGYMLQVLVTDGTEYLTAKFFAKSQYMLHTHKNILKIGETVLFSGTVSTYNGVKQLVHPEFESIELSEDYKEEVSDLDFSKNLQEYVNKPIPIYPASNGFASWKVKSSIQTALSMVDKSSFDDLIPKILPNPNLYSYYEAIEKLHNPTEEAEYKKARYTLKYYEAFMLNMSIYLRKKSYETYRAFECKTKTDGFADRLVNNLPYELTNAQKRVVAEIQEDISKKYPMHRMVMGDVGSGKTIVALLSMLRVVDNGYQAVLLAPTEVLATQHYEGICNLLGKEVKTILDPLTDINNEVQKVDVNLYTAATPTKLKKEVLSKLATGTPGIFIGTHALLSDKVLVNNIGLVVVDEQHRFGVEQRQKLLEKSEHVPHMLSMSATPIPRTLAVTIFGDMTVSIIDEKPAGRKPIQTFLMNPNKVYVKDGQKKTWQNRLWEKAREEINAGNCIYVVVPKISDGTDERNDLQKPSKKSKTAKASGENKTSSSSLEIISIDEAYSRIKNSEHLRDVKIQTLSSKTTPSEKEEIISNFSTGQAPILISTTVVEVGVDVKNATMIVIMDAHRFGLATLHQLRGRVGRNDKQSYCMLLTDLDDTHPSYTKLEEFSKTNDGFKIAELDLSIRKEGDILGVKQSGRKSTLKFLNVIRDIDIIHKSLADIKENEDIYMSSHDNDKFDEQVEVFFSNFEENYWFKS